MRVLKKKLHFTVMLVLMMCLIIGCSSNGKTNQGSSGGDSANGKNGETAKGEDNKPVELSFIWWGEQARHDRTQEAIKLFEEQNPDIKIKAEFSGWDGYWEKMATRAAGKNMPDLVQMSSAYLAEYTDRGLLVDLTQYIDSGIINFDNVQPALKEIGKIGDHIYSVSLGTSNSAMFYDPAMFEKAGVQEPKPGYTYEEMEDMSKQIKDNFGKGYFGITTFNNSEAFSVYLRQNGQDFYNEDFTDLGFDDQLLIDYYNYWLELMNNGISTTAEDEAGIQGLEDSFLVLGKSPMAVGPANTLAAFTEASGRSLKMTTYPSVPNGLPGQTAGSATHLSISANSQNPEEAARFIDFMTNSLEANLILMADRGVPISSKIREGMAPELDDVTKQLFEYMDTVEDYTVAAPVIGPAGGGEITDLFNRLSDAVNYGELKPEDMAKQFRPEAVNILQSNN
ncbi:sugar ABC transporter substrate-binding protein [Bacillus sp. FJAT-49711]|uniref:ABC transporter substrate-binding protein n=1 Tax=Bacillus sp. FJAT-49711 TaxID=2833585 RepID=UPI001BCA45D1|nr:sugar ABC transporter substrate-binding protein [Bacillus sp. FJAT-49711]MBS4218699.1 sugar ABC transporter substrate-binding protein [Bacillus sp. FJAT-49711]